jgi:5S rRNA maturation endonuclease (ribonuclease M5)
MFKSSNNMINKEVTNIDIDFSKRSPNESSMIFMDIGAEGHILRQRIVREFTSIDKRYIRGFRGRTKHIK